MREIALFKCDLDSAALAVVRPVFASGQLVSGPNVAALENDISELAGGRAAVAVSDMTHALALALRLSDVGTGDEVLTLSFNCLASTAAISSVGAVPVWVDVDPRSASMSVEDLGAAISRRTKAVIVYHVAGYPADLSGVKRVCDDRGLTLIEDANNALGAWVDNCPVGTVGDFAVFSFYANRQVNAVEGAVLVCSDPAMASKAMRLRRYGIDVARFRDKFGEIDPIADIETIGMAASLPNVNAALARHGLGSLAERLEQTRVNVSVLSGRLSQVAGLVPVAWRSNARPSFWVWLVLTEQRDKLLLDLKSNGIQCSKLHHPNHTYSGFKSAARHLPGTAILTDQALGLPCGWWLNAEALSRIGDTIRASLSNQ